VRKPKQYALSRPGDLVQVHTLEVRPVPGVVLKQFTARDVVSRWDVIHAHARATASAATQFLDTLQHRMPFRIRAVQIDGGSEFAAEFEQACQQRGLHLFVLPPRSPKLNGSVERANRTHTEEFYQVTPCSLEIKKLNRELRQWGKIYNTVRPHQSLGYLTPRQFLLQNSSQRKE
jgi:putative transposase